MGFVRYLKYLSIVPLAGCAVQTDYDCLSDVHWEVSKSGIHIQEYKETSFKDVTVVGGDCEDFAYTMYKRALKCPHTSNHRLIKFHHAREGAHAVLLVQTKAGGVVLDYLHPTVYSGNEYTPLYGQSDLRATAPIVIPKHKK